MSDSSTIHVPLEPAIRKRFTAKAKELGFDSAQAYLRVIIKAAVDGRRIDMDIDEWGHPSPEAIERLNKLTTEALADSKADKLPSFTDTKTMMDFLDRDKTD